MSIRQIKNKRPLCKWKIRTMDLHPPCVPAVSMMDMMPCNQAYHVKFSLIASWSAVERDSQPLFDRPSGPRIQWCTVHQTEIWRHIGSNMTSHRFKYDVTSVHMSCIRHMQVKVSDDLLHTVLLLTYELTSISIDDVWAYIDKLA